MINSKNHIEKICSFYVSEWHLATMILPYVNKELNEKAKITTILENNIENNIVELTKKLNLKNEEKILEIDWKEIDGRNYLNVVKKFNKLNINKNNIIFIKGSKDYINTVNKNIDYLLQNNIMKYQNLNLKIINCYEVTEFNGNIDEILQMHIKILNTSGERYIYEVFGDSDNIIAIC